MSKEKFEPEILIETSELGEIRGINPDRVQTEEGGLVVETQAPRITLEAIKRRFHLPTLSVEFSMREFMPRLIATGTLLGTLMANVDKELISGEQNQPLKTAVVKESLDTTNIETLVKETREELCKVSGIDLMHRFVMKDENGNEYFNPGGFIMPLSVSVAEKCNAKVDVEVHFPYHLARTFTEIITKNPENRDEAVEKIAAFIATEIQKNYLVIRGVAGITDTTYVYNRETNEILAGKQVKVDLEKLKVENIQMEGSASAEAEKSAVDAGEASLHGFNPENLELAGKRMEDLKPLMIEAFSRAGVDKAVLENIQEFRYEHNLSENEIQEIAEISKKILGEVVNGSNEEIAYALIQELNNENTNVIKKLEENKDYAAALDKYIFEKREVKVSFEAGTETGKKTVYNMVFLLPLVLLMPNVRIRSGKGMDFSIKDFKFKYHPSEHNVFETISLKARRLFSETTPEKLEQERSFDEVYSKIDLSKNSQDTHNILQHMLLEEVYPSLDESTREPMIDYEKLADNCRQYLLSSTREGGVAKGVYETPEDARQKIAEELLEMWEKHDNATFPMTGIELKNVLNYRNSEPIIYWAKTLADFFTNLLSETKNASEFKTQLLEKIQQSFQARSSQRGADRNIFVKSSF